MKLTSFSHSRHERLEICGQQFVFVHIEKIRRPPGIAMMRGREFHRIVERDLKQKLETGALLSDEELRDGTSDSVNRAFKGEFTVDGDYYGMDTKLAKATVKSEIAALVGRYHHHIAPVIQPSALEVRVNMKAGKVLPVKFSGVIDCIDSGIIVHDSKTKRKAPDWNAADVEEQLSAYAMLFRAHYGKYPERLDLDVVWQTPAKKLVDHRSLPTLRGQDDVKAYLARVNRSIELVEAERFLPARQSDWVCDPKYCGFTDLCPFYRRSSRPEN